MTARTLVRPDRDGRLYYKPHQRYTLRLFAEDWTEENQPQHYYEWLIAMLGKPMRRALIRARQRYDAQKPAQRRASALHTAYGRRR